MQMIFMTGLPRSGTTWAGYALAEATRSVMIHEPFNYEWHPERASYHMKYLPAGSARNQEMIDIVRQELFPWRRPRRRLLVMLTRRVVVRDVLACLAIEHLWEHFKPLTMIMVRHPCGVASSWKAVGFEVRPRMENLLGQERLLADHLGPFEEHMRSQDDFYFQIGAYWGASYLTMRRIAAAHPDWQWVTHEGLCFGLQEAFSKVLKAWRLKPASALSDFLQEHNREPSGEDNRFSVVRRSTSEPEKWKQLLMPRQIRSVLAGAEPFGIMEIFYPSEG